MICKALGDVGELGGTVKKVMERFNITNPEKIVVGFTDATTLSGSIAIQSGTDIRGCEKNLAINSISSAIGTTNYIRLKMGFGVVENSFMFNVLPPGEEMDKFGYCLDISGQGIFIDKFKLFNI